MGDTWVTDLTQFRKRHKGIIIELILISVDIFEVSSIFNYSPGTVLRFIERVCLDGQWRIRKCGVCKNQFVAFGRKSICRMTACERTEKTAETSIDSSKEHTPISPEFVLGVDNQ